MSMTPTLTPSVAIDRSANAEPGRSHLRGRRTSAASPPFHLASRLTEADAPQRHAELFYLQKQIQSQTPMVIVLEDGEQITGCIEWYDRCTLKVRGKTKNLIYKSAIKYMYKLGDVGQ